MSSYFNQLPAKIELLATTIKKLQDKIRALEEENRSLIEKIDGMASALHMHASDVKTLTEERESTALVLEELIKSIDCLITQEQQQS